MKTALVTGAAGFVGGAVAAEFAARGWHVLALCHRRISPALDRLAQGPCLTILRGDVTQPDGLTRSVDSALRERGFTLDAIVHVAGRASDIGPWSEFKKVNAESVRPLAAMVRDRNAARLVFVSTTDVYGLRDFRGEGEDDLPLEAYPRNPYPLSKIAAEQYLRTDLPPDRYSIIRPAQVWGVGDRTLTPRILDFLRWSPWIVHFGPWRGTNRWPLAHVRNVARACFLAAVHPEAAGKAIHVLDTERTSIDEFYRIVADLYLPGKRFRTVVLPMEVGVGFGRAVTGLSNLLRRDHPLADPSHYAVYAVSRNLDFSNRRFVELLAAHGEPIVSREEGIRKLKESIALP